MAHHQTHPSRAHPRRSRRHPPSPKAQLLLRRCRSSAWAETLLDHFLLLADTYGRFREAMASLHRLTSEAQVALRRKDKQGLAVAAKAGKKVEKDVRKLLSSLRELGRGQDSIPTVAGGNDDEIMGALREARMAFCSVSAAVFMGAVGLSSSAFRVSTTMASYSSWSAIRKAVAAPAVATGERLKEVEECMVSTEIGSEKVLRHLLNTRVLLLNTLEPL